MDQELITVVEAIKTAILQSQYQAAKETTRVQLRKELLGLRGFSATSLKKMRLFYENWSFLEDSNSSVMTDELPEKLNSSKKTVKKLHFLVFKNLKKLHFLHKINLKE